LIYTKKREDLRKNFPNEQKNNFRNLIDWAATHGIVIDDEKEILEPHGDYYFENCSQAAKPLANSVRRYLKDTELQKKFPEVRIGELQRFCEYMNKITLTK